jgi:hypothetical protein
MSVCLCVRAHTRTLHYHVSQGGWFVRGITDGNATGNDPATVLADAGCTAETVDLLRMFRVQRASLLRTPSFAASEAFESGAAAATFALPLSADTRLVLSVQRCPRHDPFRNMFDDESVVVDDELDVFHSAVTLNCVGKCGTLARFCVADDDCAGLGASTCMPLAARLFESESICVEMTVNASLSLAENLVSAVRVTDDVACDSRAAYEAAATQNAVCAVGNGFVPMGFNYTVYKWESKECFQRVCDASGEFRELGSGDKEACPSPCNSACGWDALVLLDGVNCLEVSTAVELKPLMDDIGDSFNGEVCVPHNARVRFPLRVADGGVLGDSWRAANIVPTALQLLAELVTANNRYRMSDSGREALIADWKQWLARGSDGVATGGGDIGVCMFPHAAQRAAVNLVPGDVAFEHTAADGVKSALSGVQFASTLLWSALDAPTHNCTLVADEGAAVPHRVVCADPRKPSSADNDLLRYARDATTATAADTAVDPFWALVDEGVWANVTDVKYGGGDDRNYVTLLATTCGWSSWLAFPGTFLETQVNVPGAAMLYQRAMRAAARLLDDRMYALRDTVFAGYTRAAVRESAVAALLPYSLHYVALNYFIDDYSGIGIDEPNFVFGKQAAQLLRQPGDIWSLLRDAADGNKPVAFLGDALAERLRRAVDWSAVFTAKPFVSFQLSLMNDYPDFPYGIAISAQACGGGRAALPELQVGLTGAHPDAFNLRGCDIGTVCPDTLYGKGKCTRYDELYDWWGQLSTVATNEIRNSRYNKEGTFFQAKHLGIETTTMAKTIAYRPVLRSIIDTLIAPVMNFTRPWFDYDEFVRLLQVQTQSATRCTRAEDEWEGMEGARDMFVELVRSVVPPARRSIARGNQIGVCVPDLDLVTSALGLNGSPLELIKAAEIDEATRLKMEQAKAAEAAAALKTLVQPPPAPQRGKRELSYDDPDSFAPTVEPYTPPPRVARNDNGILLRCMPFADTALDAEPGHEDEQFKPCAGRASPASATQEDVNSGSFSKPVMWLLIALAIACCVVLLLLLLAFLLVRRHRSRQQAEQRRQPSPDGDGRRTPRSRNPRRRTGRAAVGDTARHATDSDHDAAAAAY